MRQPITPTAPAASLSRLAAPYVAFALLSTAVNLGTQQIAVGVLAGRLQAVLPMSLACGTAAGFAAKYLLDKHFIFFDRSTDVRDEARKVALYGCFSVLTTLLFWGTEIGFLTLFGTVAAKYTGAVVGLALGYALKFMLDRRFTFTDRDRPHRAPDATAVALAILADPLRP